MRKYMFTNAKKLRFYDCVVYIITAVFLSSVIDVVFVFLQNNRKRQTR